MLDENEKGTRSMRTPGGEQVLSIVSEAGMYSLDYDINHSYYG